MNEKNKMVIVFSEKAHSAFSDIEKKYNLEESDKEAIEAIKKDRVFKINIVIKLSREFITKKITELQFIESLQKDLNIDKTTAQNIIKDVITNITPNTKKLTKEELKQKEIHDIEEEVATEPTIQKPVKEKPQLKKRLPAKKTVTKKSEKSGPDAYREPIE